MGACKTGKLSNRNIRKLLSCIKKDPRVIVPPSPGFDSGVHLIGDKYLVVSTDPCINVPKEWFGWLLIHYASSDVALFGAKPEYCTINLLGPLSTRSETFYETMKQACEAADELNMAIVTGHTGTYNGLSTLIGVCTAYGTVERERLITPDGAKPEDYILCTKPIGLETAINFASTHGTLAEKLFGTQRTQELANLVNIQSCVKEALLLAEIGGVHAMHDATEGGLTAALNEMAETSKAGFKIESDKISVSNEAHTLQQHFKLSYEQTLAMSSTGTILAAVNPEAKDMAEKTLRRNGLEPSFLGFFTKRIDRILMKNGKEMPFPKKAYDPYARIVSGNHL
jgi:hydrogenase expression/formation protein HypE